jgi:methionine-rich copper-binding protein CopC
MVSQLVDRLQPGPAVVWLEVKGMQKRLMPFAVVLLSLLAVATRADAHAFVDHAEPRVGSNVKKAPDEVRIWFTEAIEPAFINIKVLDASGKQVDKKDKHLDRSNHALLHVSLMPSLAPGTYRVVWRVCSVDTHVTNGDFRFQILP